MSKKVVLASLAIFGAGAVSGFSLGYYMYKPIEAIVTIDLPPDFEFDDIPIENGEYEYEHTIDYN